MMQLLKCKAGQLLFYGCDREKAVAAWRWHVNNAMKGE